MKKFIAAGIASVMFLCCGCAQRAQHPSTGEEANLSGNDERINNLENRVDALNSQIAQLNSREYEIRTRTGQKTSMKVVPVNSAQAALATSQPVEAAVGDQPVSASSPQPASAAPAQPQGRKINPATRPTPIPKNQPKPAVAKPEPKKAPAPKTAGPNGAVGQAASGATPPVPTSSSFDEFSLPPAELPPANVETNVPVPTLNPPAGSNDTSSNYRAPVQASESTPPVPVPVMPESGLALPPETTAPAASSALNPASAPAAAPAAAPKAQPAATKSAALPKGEVNAYNAALKAVRSGKTNEGIQMFRQFLQQYPNGRYAANADYWIGECLYQQGKYQDALSQFNTVNSSFPKHHKNADALLKAGLTFSKMGDKASANEKFKSVLANFPNSDAARRVRAMGIH